MGPQPGRRPRAAPERPPAWLAGLAGLLSCVGASGLILLVPRGPGPDMDFSVVLQPSAGEIQDVRDLKFLLKKIKTALVSPEHQHCSTNLLLTVSSCTTLISEHTANAGHPPRLRKWFRVVGRSQEPLALSWVLYRLQMLLRPQGLESSSTPPALTGDSQRSAPEGPLVPAGTGQAALNHGRPRAQPAQCFWRGSGGDRLSPRFSPLIGSRLQEYSFSHLLLCRAWDWFF